MRHEGLARRLVWREPYDGTREGFTLTVRDSGMAAAIASAAASIPAIDNDPGKGNVLQAIGRARAWARGYGGALIVGLLDDGRAPTEPLDEQNVASFHGVRVLDRHEAWVAKWHEQMDRPRDLGKPEIWQVQLTPSKALYIHASRCVQLQGVTLTPRQTFANQGWGGSQLDLVWGAYRNWQSSLEYLPEFVGLLTQGVFKQKNLAESMVTDGGRDAIVRRYETLRSAMGVLGELAIDADEEDYEILQRPVAGVAEVFGVLVEAFQATVDIPQSILLGKTLGGLNTGENAGEIRAYYDDVAARQRLDYTPPTLGLLRWICMAKDGPTAGVVPADLGLVWKSLWQPTRAEDDAHDLSRAQRRGLDVSSTSVTSAEVRLDPDLQRLYPGFEPDAEVAGAEGAEEDPDGELDPIVEAPASSMPNEPLVDAKTAAAKLGVGRGTIRNMAVSGQIRAWRVGTGRRWRFAWSEIEAAVQGRVP